MKLDDICITSTEFEKPEKIVHTMKRYEILKSNEFRKKYSFFIKIIYSCMKMNIEIFNNNNTIKNNYHLIRTLITSKKKNISGHIDVLKNYQKEADKVLPESYQNYINDFLVKIRILDKIILSINKIIASGIFSLTDNLISLIIPYFYNYTDYIEEYN